nr:reverse transcriptase domain-containing protein [Tanacetum cinerariifolium]
MRTRNSYFLNNSSVTIPIRQNKRRTSNVDEPELCTIVEVALMADSRTMEELLQAPTEGYGEAIVILEINADHFEIKMNLLQLGSTRVWYDKEPPNSILTWEDLVNKFVNHFFPPSKTSHLKNEISRYTQRFEETFGEACERFKEMLRACLHYGFIELAQIDTFYNGLNDNDQDSLNVAASGNLLSKTTREALQIIENKSKVCYSRNKPNISRMNTTFRENTSKKDDRIDKLANQISTLVDIFAKKVVTPAPVKAVEESCVACGGPHAHYNCDATNRNQPSVCMATGTYNQVAPQNRASKYMAPPGYAPVQNNQNRYNQGQGNNFNRENNFHGNQPFQVPNQRFQNQLFKFLIIKFNKNQASTSGTLSINTIPSPKGEMKANTTRSGVAYEGPLIPTNHSPKKAVERETEETTDKEQTNFQGSTAHIQPSVTLIPEPNVSKTLPKPNIPYPSRLNDQKSSSKLSRDQTSNPTSSTNPIPKGRIRRSSKQKVENSHFEEHLTPVATMTDNRTVAEMLCVPIEGCAEAIVVPPILAEQFELKHRAASRWLEKEPPHLITTWDDLVSKFINEFFPPPRTTNLRNEISNFQQKFDESFHEAWERYKDLLHACPYHGFTELHQLDTFYNALNPADQDFLNAAAGGNLLEKATSVVTTAMTAMLKQLQANPPPAQVKAVEEICVTCKGAHPYYQCLAAGGNTFSEFRDNIQGYVSVAPESHADQIDMVKNELRNEMKTSIQTSLSNQTNEIKNMMASLLQMNTASTSGSRSLPGNAVANLKGKLKAITTRSGLVTDGPTIPTPPKSVTPEEEECVEETYMDPDLTEYTIKVPPPPQEKDDIQIHKFWNMFKQLHLNITLAEALVLMPKYQKILKALLSNKEKLQELANTHLNENCSAVILKKLPEKLGDPGKFLISCGFSKLKCKALADLGASINLIPLSVWKKLGLPDFIPTRMTLELANHAICMPDGIARDVFVPVGKFTFPADFVVVDYESDPRVPLILGRPFLRTARALIDVHSEEMILRDGDKRLTLNMKHDTTSYSNHPQRESVNFINIFNLPSEDCLEVSVSNQKSGNPTFSLHKEITSLEVTHEIYDSEGCTFLSEELPDIDSFNDIHPHFDDDPLSNSTTYSYNLLLKEFTDELALITYPPDYDDNITCDIESDLREIEFLLYQGEDSDFTDSIDQTDLVNLDDLFVDPTPEMFTDEHAPDYSFSSRFNLYPDDFLEIESDADNFYDDLFDSKGEKIKESELLIDQLDLPCDILPYSKLSCFQSQHDFHKPDEDFSCSKWKEYSSLGCSSVLFAPEKLGDPDEFLIPCDFPRIDVCHALADLGASINLIPLSIWKKLSLPELTPTRMTLELADRSITRPKGVAEDVFVKVGKFHFPTNFVVVDFEVDPRVPLILERSFLRTGRALIDVYGEEITLRFNDEAVIFNLNQTTRYSSTYDDLSVNRIDIIDVAREEYAQEILGFSKNSLGGNPTSTSEPIISDSSPSFTPFEGSDFILEEIKAYLKDESISPKIDHADCDPKGDICLIEKLLNNDPFQLPPMDLKLGEVVKGIDPRFCTHKILMEEDYKPTVQSQRRVNPKIHEVIKKEVIKLFDARMIYPISDSPWVSPIHYVPKKCGITVVENENNELIPTRLVTEWRVCIDYRKLNDATRKDHFPLPFMDQMLERLAGNEFYCFLDEFSGYLQIPINLPNQEKTTFTCPYGTFAYRRMPFGLCNAPGTFQMCMMAIFHDMIEKTMKVFMDDFSVFGDSFSSCLFHLDTMLQRCEDTNLVLNWEKCHFMVKEGIVLGHEISKNGLKVDRAKVDVIAKLPHPTTIKGVRSFLGHASFYRRFIQDFSKIARPMTHLLEKETPFVFSKDCIGSFETLKKKLTEATILGIDFMGPFSSSRGNRYILVAVDYYSKWVEAKALPTNDARVVVNFLKSLFARFRTPRAIISDRGTHILMINLLKTVRENRASWSEKLEDALWDFKTAYKTPIMCTPYKLVYGKSCHLPIELEHKAYWALKHVNFDLKTVGDHRKLQLNELNEICDQAYGDSLIYKEKTKKLHDAKIKNCIFNVVDRVLLFNSRLKIFSGKLKTHWSGPFTITKVFPYGTVELSQPDGPNFKVNGHRVKHYFGEDVPQIVVPDMCLNTHTFDL